MKAALKTVRNSQRFSKCIFILKPDSLCGQLKKIKIIPSFPDFLSI